MTVTPRPGDQARASVLVRVPPEEAFRLFTEEIDQWWRRGKKYRVAGDRRGIIALEGGVGGRVFESFESKGGTRVIETGQITHWDPPHGFRLRWRNVNFAPHEHTSVEVEFAPTRSGTHVTVTHRGWADIRDDHPARHGQAVAAFVGSMGMWWGDQLSALRHHAEP